MRSRIQSHAVVLHIVVLWACLFFHPAALAADDGQDWPCIQGLVRDISPSVIWAGPPVDDHLDTWYADVGVSRTVEALVSRRATDEDRANSLSNWLNTIPDDQRQAQLTAVFTGAWSRLNSRRKEFIDGILRYARHQKSMSEKIQSYLNELADLQDEADEASIRRLVQIEETVKWQERIFDQREANLQLLCEQPVKVEQTLGEIARLVAGQME